LLDHAAGFFNDHLGDLNVALGWFIEGRTDDLSPAAGAFHIRDFFWPFID